LSIHASLFFGSGSRRSLPRRCFTHRRRLLLGMG
jgi:hypothetical protein